MEKILSFLILLIVGSNIECARILAVVTTPSISHQVVFRPLVKELARRGHQCVLVTTDPTFKEKSQNITEIDVHDMSYARIPDLIAMLTGEKEKSVLIVNAIFQRMSLVLDEQMQLPEVKELLKPGSFDLVIGESYIRPIVGLAHKLKAPMILMSSFGGMPINYEMLGAPVHPLFYPYFIQQKTYNLTFYEKIYELSLLIRYELDKYWNEDMEYDIMRRNFGDDVPSFRELYRKYVKMLFINEHPLWAENRPVPPNIKYIGGIHKPQEKPLPKELKTFLDASTRGVIYFSLGSNAMPSLLPADKINMILRVLSRMPYDVMFRWPLGDFPGTYSNIKFFRWMPQSDLLKHPNIKLFITQGGLQSTDEAINAAVPLIGIPIFADQYYNVEKYERYNVGLKLDINTITEEAFEDALNRTTGDPSFKTNMVLLRSRMRELPIDSLDLAVWWTEHIIKHGGDHLQPLTSGTTWSEYYEIPFVCTILFILFLALIFLTFCLKGLLGLVFATKIKIKTL